MPHRPMLTFKQCHSSLFLIGLMFFFVCPLAAGQSRIEAAPEFKLKGLTFRCASCVQYDDELCTVPFEGAPALVPCSRAIQLLLADLISSNYDEKAPSAEELRNYLFTSRNDKQSAKYTLLILLKSINGRTELRRYAPDIYQAWPDVVKEVVRELQNNQELLRELNLLFGFLLETTAKTEQPQRSFSIPEQHYQTEGAEIKVRGEKNFHQRIWLILSALTATFLFLVKYRRTGSLTPPSSGLRQGRSDLRLLRRYFQLGPEDGIEALKRQYRKRARELHPDTGQDNSEDFITLQRNYQKAKSLMNNLSSPS